jgi:ion channel-forming bestrophin family protein
VIGLEAEPQRFWRYAFALRGTATPHVLPRVLVFGVIAALITLLHRRVAPLEIAVGPVELSGAAIALILVLRTNSGYERWWEARKLWGGIVNQSRNLAVSALRYGPDDRAWGDAVARWTAAFPHVMRASLRGEPAPPEAARLLGASDAAAIGRAAHMPSYVAARLADLLRQARRDRGGLDDFAFLQVDSQRAQLIDHLGGCERILRTPLAFAYAVKVRRFIVLYLVLLPFALVGPVGWLTPLVTMFVAYPLLGLDHIGTELQNPFSPRSLSHLPLETICATIERDVMALVPAATGSPR